jgi:hypothetical protein
MNHYKGVFEGYVVSGWEYSSVPTLPEWKLLIYSNTGELEPQREYVLNGNAFYRITEKTLSPDASVNMRYDPAPVDIPRGERSAILKALEAWKDAEPTKF